jgi:hypothetical protein
VVGAFIGSAGLGVGAVPGAVAGTAAGAEIGQMLLGFIGLKSVVEYMLDQLPVAIDEYRKGFLVAWGPMPSMHDMFSERPASSYNFESNAMAAGNFARGHEIIIMALLMGIVTYLGRGKGNLKALMAEASSHSKLGPKFATWLEQNERELSASPILQSRPKGGGQAGSQQQAIGAPRQSRNDTAKADERKGASKTEGDPHESKTRKEQAEGTTKSTEDERRLFENKFPMDAIGDPKIVPIQALKNMSGNLNYVVLEDGRLIVGKSPHTSLTKNGPVKAAGEIQLHNGKVKWLDNASGHYQPTGPQIKKIAESAFEKIGIDAAGKFQYKVWVPNSSLPRGGKWVKQ